MKMKIFDESNNVYDAVDSVIKFGVAAVAGTKTSALAYCDRIVKALAPYKSEGITPYISYKNVSNNGYLYYVYNIDKFTNDNLTLDNLVDEIDRLNS